MKNKKPKYEQMTLCELTHELEHEVSEWANNSKPFDKANNDKQDKLHGKNIKAIIAKLNKDAEAYFGK